MVQLVLAEQAILCTRCLLTFAAGTYKQNIDKWLVCKLVLQGKAMKEGKSSQQKTEHDTVTELYVERKEDSY